jgi:hypothetical protein
MKGQGKRLNILTGSEIQELYGLPKFTYEDRIRYFFLNPLEEKELDYLRSTKSKVYYILQLGYFKAKKMFFTFNYQDVKEDIHYIIQRYFPQDNELSDIEVSKPTRLTQQAVILKLLNYQLCTQENKKELQERAHYLVTIYTRPIYVFKELFNYMKKHRIVIPGYSFMQEDIVGKALTDERNRLETAVMQYIPEEGQRALEKLLSAEDNLYELTFLKREPRDFSYKEITQERVSRRFVLKYTLRRFLFSNEHICL